jgi:tetratricopeptide (TPR) repeat protein
MATPKHRPMCLIAVIIAAWLPSAARAADGHEAPEAAGVAEARRSEMLATQAFALYKQGLYRDAVRLYVQAHEVAPAAALLFNIARLYDQKLGQPDAALDYYRRVLASADLDPALAARARARSEALGADAARAARRVVPAAPSAPRPARDGAAGATWLKTAGAVAAGVGVLGLGVGSVFGLQARSKEHAAERLCAGRDCANEQALRLTDQAQQAAHVSTLSFVAAGSLLAGGLGAYFLAARGRAAAAPAAASWRLAPALAPGGGGLSVALRWP